MRLDCITSNAANITPATCHLGAYTALPAAISSALVGESLRGNRIGATGLRASERKSASERVSEREGFQRFLRGLERFFRGFERF